MLLGRRYVLERRSFELLDLPALVLPGKIPFNEEFAVFNNQDTVNVLVGAVLDPSEALIH